MDALAPLSDQLALALGASWASGLNLYAVAALLGFGSLLGWVELPAGLAMLQDPVVLGAAALLYLVEFVTDKIPGVDSVWDGLHTFIRIPAGAMIAAGALGDAGMLAEAAALAFGGGLAATAHATKAGGRAVINTSPEPVSNWIASITEDVAVIAGLWAALNQPWLLAVFLVLFLLFAAWLLPRVWRLLTGVIGSVGRLFGGRRDRPRRPGEPRRAPNGDP